MAMWKKTFLLSVIVLSALHDAQAQVAVGVYSNGILTQIGVGSNPEKKLFGEGRVLAGDYYNRFLGLEALGQVNVKRSDWHNISVGIMLGYYDYSEGIRVGFPLIVAIKPVEAHRDFAVILEATPMYAEEMALRGNLGIRYTLGN